MVPCGLRGGLRRAVQAARVATPTRISNAHIGRRCVSSVLVKPPQYGQPYPATHPRLLKETELTPGFPASEYHERRKRLMESLPEGSVVVCMGGTVRYMTEHIFYKFRQSTDFYYLTGFAEPDSTLILESAPSTSKGYKMTLFVPPSNPKQELWEGSITGPTRAVTLFGADEAHSNTLLSHYLPNHLSAPHVFAELPPSPSPSPSSQPFHPPSPRKRSSLLKLFSPASGDGSGALGGLGGNGEPPHLMIAAALTGERAKPLQGPLQRLRTVKSEREIKVMKKAADLSAAAHTRVMRETKPGMSEAQIQAIFEYHCAMGGSERPAYVPVVASGANGLVIHYTRNDCVAEEEDLILIDAGCEYAMYASDITRTYPASGRFTDPQRDLYTAVLNAQKGVLAKCKVENGVNLQELQSAACRLLEEELRQIGFRLSSGDLQRKGLYPHYISHHLGSDLHDCATYDRNATLVYGNVITVEPGVYVPTSSDFPSHFHGLGIRIEDDIAFTDKGTVILSAHAPKEIVDVEGACQGVLEA